MISVLMLTYNRENMVSRAIESILKQTYKDFEFIIVDNGSTDSSGRIADEYAKKDDRIIVIHIGTGMGIASARNIAVDAANGDYYAFIDDDDWVEPDYLEFLLKLLTENNADISICGSSVRNSDEKCVLDTEQALTELVRRKKFTVSFPTAMFRKELWENLRFPKVDVHEDLVFMHIIMARAKLVAYHGLLKYTIYDHEGNISAWTKDNSLINSEILDNHLKIYRSRTEWLSERFPDSASVFRFYEWSFMISLVEKINRYDLRDCEKHLIYMTSVLKEHRDEFLGFPEIKNFEKEWFDKYITV